MLDFETPLLGEKGSRWASRKAVSNVPSCIVNCCKTMVGAGILGLPYAVSSLGLVLGLFFLVVFGLVGAYSLWLLLQCGMKVERRWLQKAEYLTEPPPVPTFRLVTSEIAPYSTILTDFAALVLCFGVTIVYLQVLGQLLPDLMKLFFGYGMPTVLYDRHLWISISMIVLAPLSFLQKLDNLKYTSVLGLTAIAYISVMIVCYYFVGDFVVPSSQISMATFNTKSLSALGIIAFAFAGHINIYTIYKELGSENLERRSNIVVLTAIAIVMVVYSLEAAFGYLTFGPKVDANIINNYPIEPIAVVIARVCVSIVEMCSFPLLFHPARTFADSILFGKHPASWYSLQRYLTLTVALLCVSFGIAMWTSQLAVVLSVIGATGVTFLGFQLPGYLYLVSTRGCGFTLHRAAAACVMVLGVAIMVVSLTMIVVDAVLYRQ
eukprot:TRINITY_DN647_c0_g1_i2.p1 TRINITY_DN647_c0_g1~~TRINITY_DN647_c0_g1_i2.p1  ORF type:complete len:435 (-),score=84.15 TRINITY_DN647_c0_g1_i2:82-1386(-)